MIVKDVIYLLNKLSSINEPNIIAFLQEINYK
jgi:hypothetical protein